MTRQLTRGWQRRALTALRWYLVVAFAFGGAIKFFPNGLFGFPPYSERFVDWGYPSWFRFVVGSGEILAAVLLTLPRRRFLAAGILVVILIGATITHVVNQDPLGESVSAPLHLVMAAVMAWSARPSDRRDLGTRPRGRTSAPADTSSSAAGRMGVGHEPRPM